MTTAKEEAELYKENLNAVSLTEGEIQAYRLIHNCEPYINYASGEEVRAAGDTIIALADKIRLQRARTEE